MSRNEHDRTTSHKDSTRALFVTSGGSDLESVLRGLWERLLSLDSPPPPFFSMDSVFLKERSGAFSADAFKSILFNGSFTADAISRLVQEASFLVDSWVQFGGVLTADSVFLQEQSGSFALDAALLLVSSGSFTADAWVAMGGTFSAYALFQKTTEGTFSADAAMQGTTIIRPASDVVASGETRSSGTTNWNLVDEVGLDSADWVDCKTNGAYFIVQCNNPGLTGHYIRKINLMWNGQNGAPAQAGATLVRNPDTGTRYDVTTIPQNPSGSTVNGDLLTRPWDGQPWTGADIDQLQIGARTHPSSLPKIRTWRLYVTVTHQ